MKDSMKKTVHSSIRMTPKVAENLTHVAEIQGLTRTALITNILCDYVACREQAAEMVMNSLDEEGKAILVLHTQVLERRLKDGNK
jgi:predicted transcriptional regulator